MTCAMASKGRDAWGKADDRDRQTALAGMRGQSSCTGLRPVVVGLGGSSCDFWLRLWLDPSKGHEFATGGFYPRSAMGMRSFVLGALVPNSRATSGNGMLSLLFPMIAL